MPGNKKIQKEIIKICQWLYQKGLIVAMEGNVSCKNQEGNIWITPTHKPKGFLKKNDLILVNSQGDILRNQNHQKPTSELIMHLEVYRHRQDISAIIHAHPPYCIAATLTGISFIDTDLPEIFLTLGNIPTAPYALTGTKEMFEAIQPYLDSNAILLSHHGVITLGKTLKEAYFRLEQLEHSAKILCIAKSTGNIQSLPESRKEEIRNLRLQIHQEIEKEAR